jgi:hypothetical protein
LTKLLVDFILFSLSSFFLLSYFSKGSSSKVDKKGKQISLKVDNNERFKYLLEPVLRRLAPMPLLVEWLVLLLKISRITGSMSMLISLSTAIFSFLYSILSRTHYLNFSPITEDRTLTIHYLGNLSTSFVSGK